MLENKVKLLGVVAKPDAVKLVLQIQSQMLRSSSAMKIEYFKPK
jgi:hypothetical protein